MSVDSSSPGDEVAEVRIPAMDDFIAFITKAETIVHPSTISAAKPRLVQNFMSFVTKAGAIVSNPASATAVSNVFQQFIDKAMPTIFADIENLQPQIAERANLVARWLVKDDLLAVAGCRFVEDAYTELMAWALRPETHPPSARQRQSAWLAALGLDREICNSSACEPLTQVRTDDGIPDLVMRFEHLTICVEAKTGSAEHLTPSGIAMQTEPEGYPHALRKTLNLEHAPIMVFITPDGRQASSDGAVCTTYTQFVLALAGALDGSDMPHETRAAFAILFTHMLTCATSISVDVPGMIEQIRAWSTQPDWGEYRKINQRWATLLQAIEFFKLERRQ